MNLGAILRDPFEVQNFTALQAAVATTCREFGLAVAQLRVGYAARGELGQRIVVHRDPGGARRDEARDPSADQPAALS